ncbi:uncharacterized protein LOC123221428 [Mangifera indica]|uniref:uncharacterized protein LOC123221428 n=1 Tax=Mangifera indica TaxID=29780 RepID=UPI001CFA686C|nr:uncharacterized protein LOC123221428 [Mangifera indica]
MDDDHGLKIDILNFEKSLRPDDLVDWKGWMCLWPSKKLKVHWLKEGDKNTNYFFKCIKGSRNINSIHGITLEDGTYMFELDKVKEKLVSHIEALALSKDIDDDEIRSTIFSMDNNKPPGPNGYGTSFFKAVLDIVGTDDIKAIKHFFSIKHLLKEVNCTILALVPKFANPSFYKDFWSIACCNTIFKCITKIIVDRLKCILSGFINKAQSAFVGGRSIWENILLSQEIMHGYHIDSKEKKCTMKINHMKAHGSLNWDFIGGDPHYHWYPSLVCAMDHELCHQPLILNLLKW